MRASHSVNHASALVECAERLIEQQQRQQPGPSPRPPLLLPRTESWPPLREALDPQRPGQALDDGVDPPGAACGNSRTRCSAG